MSTRATPCSPAAIDRRAALAVGLGWLGLAALGRPARAAEKPGPLLDLHVHLFGVGDAGSGCRMQKVITDGWQFKGPVWALRLRHRAKSLDEGYEHALIEHVTGSRLDVAAILGQDAAYTPKGEADWDRTSFYVSNDYVFAVSARHPKRLIPCPLINPDRA